MKIRHNFLALGISSLLLLSGCNDKTNSLSGIYDHGVVITNEGNFGSNTGSVSFYSPVTDTIYNNIFEQINNVALGDVVQSFSVIKDKGYIVVNNSNKVEVVLLSSFKSMGVIVAHFPRHLISVTGEKAYLTINGTSPGQVLVINTSSMTITDSIVVGAKPENLLLIGSKVFVANGNYGADSTISVIDTKTDSVIRTVNVADGACNMVTTDNLNIWIICQGNMVYNANYELIKETDAHLVKMDVSDYSIKYSKIIGVKGDGCKPFLLSSDKLGNIYYADAKGVHKVTASATNPVDMLLIPWNNSSGLSIYGLKVDPYSSNIYVMENISFTSAGKFHIFDPSGHLIRSFIAGNAPNGAVSY